MGHELLLAVLRRIALFILYGLMVLAGLGLLCVGCPGPKSSPVAPPDPPALDTCKPPRCYPDPIPPRLPRIDI